MLQFQIRKDDFLAQRLTSLDADTVDSPLAPGHIRAGLDDTKSKCFFAPAYIQKRMETRAWDEAPSGSLSKATRLFVILPTTRNDFIQKVSKP